MKQSQGSGSFTARMSTDYRDPNERWDLWCHIRLIRMEMGVSRQVDCCGYLLGKKAIGKLIKRLPW